MIEILSPAGSLESFYAAIDAGADAIYLGLNAFNARAKAENFNESNIREIVEYAHMFGVKVYLTLNTLVFDNEMDEVRKVICAAKLAKVDAFIVQDLGVLCLLKEEFEGAVIHASTQMGIHNVDGAKIAERMGVKRIVLARETSLSEIKAIKENTNLEIEYFVHGALCVAFSGNCYLSQNLQGFSGNRGRCLQLCRLKYDAYRDGKLILKDKYLLSAKDLCLVENLKNLIDAGVTSFKIEGRMRRAGYVKVVTKIYKDSLEKILNNEKLDVCKVALEEAFVRGEFSEEGYLFNEKNLIDKNIQNHSGAFIGKVIGYSKLREINRAEIQTKTILNEGDGLKFFDGDEEVCSLGMKGAVKTCNGYLIYTTANLKEGLRVHRTLNAKNENQNYGRRILLDINAKFLAGDKAEIVVFYNDKSLKFFGDENLENAKTAPLQKPQIEDCLKKTNGNFFEVRSIKVETDNVFIAKAKLNELRRNFYLALQGKILKEYPQAKDDKPVEFIASKERPISKKIMVYSKFEDVVNRKNIYAIYKPYEYNLENIMKQKEIVSEKGLSFGLCLPNFAESFDVKEIDEIVSKMDGNLIISQNLWGLKYALKNPVILGENLNIVNEKSFKVALWLGAISVIKGYECKESEFGYQIEYSRQELMTFKHCPFQTIYGNNCQSCKFHEGLSYKLNSNEFDIRRIKIIGCYFKLINKKPFGEITEDIRKIVYLG